MSRFDRACLMLALVSFPLLWRFSPSLPSPESGVGRKGEQSWAPMERPGQKDLAPFRKRLLVAAPLGYRPQQKQESVVAKEQPLVLYGTFQTGLDMTALLVTGDTVQLLRQGDTLADGSTVLSIAANSMNLRLQNGDEKIIVLYEESL